MIHNFRTDKKENADAALIVYAIYRSRDKDRGPSGLGMWGQIERFIKVSSKRSVTLGEFVDKFKKKMACDTISPQHAKTDEAGFAQIQSDGSIVVKEQSSSRSFMIDVLESEESHQRKVIDALYKETQLIVLLVRARIEMEKIDINSEGK